MQEKTVITATIREQLYEILKQRITDGYYRCGAKLSDQEIGEEFHVSRSPVREALRLLQADGLLVGEANRTLTVRSFDRKDVTSLYQVEMMMQDSGVRYLSGILTPAQKQQLAGLKKEMQECCEAKDFERYFACAERFHSMIISFCDNEIMDEMYRKIGAMNHRFRRISLHNRIRCKESCAEHCAIIDALLEDDTEKAAEIMHDHLQKCCSVVIGTFTKEPELEGSCPVGVDEEEGTD